MTSGTKTQNKNEQNYKAHMIFRNDKEILSYKINEQAHLPTLFHTEAHTLSTTLNRKGQRSKDLI